MDSDGTRFAAIAETTSFLHYFKDLPDHRQAGKVDYPLPEVLLLILLAVLAGAEAFTDIARFGERKIELLRRFRPYVNGTPSHDHLGDISAVSFGVSRRFSAPGAIGAAGAPAQEKCDGIWFLLGKIRLAAGWPGVPGLSLANLEQAEQ